MAIEARLVQSGDSVDWIADADYAAGAVIQLRDGRAGVVSVDCLSGDLVGVHVGGIFEVIKTATMVVLVGSKLFWDHSANAAHLLHRQDRDFFLGAAQGGGPTHSLTIAASSAGTAVRVALNEQPVYTVSLESGFASIPVLTAGVNTRVIGMGNGVSLILDATAEAQKMDALSIRGMAPAAIALVDALICLNVNGTGAAVDFNVGLASATHATDADAIAEHLFAHVDGASLNIMAQSKDGSTTVASADTTIDAIAGTPFLVQWDLSNLSDIQMYIDGVNVLPATVFKLNAAVGPLKVLAHVEKTADAATGNFTVLSLGARTAQV